MDPPWRLSQFILDRPWLRRLAGVACAVVAYKLLLDISYYFLEPIAGYYAFLPNRLSPFKLLESYVILVLVIPLLPASFEKLSAYFLWVVALISFVPMLTIYPFRDESRPFIYAAAIFWVGVSQLVSHAPDLRLPRPPRSLEAAYVWLYVAVVATSVAVVLWYAGLSTLLNLGSMLANLQLLYEERSRFVADNIPIKGYYIHWLALVFNPVFFTMAFRRHRWVLAGLVYALQLLVSSFVGQRSYFLAPLVALTLSYVTEFRSPAAILASGLAAIVAFSAAISGLTGKMVIYLFITGRFLLVPAQLAFLYHDFFSKHGFIPFVYAIRFYAKLPIAVQYPYAQSPDLVVGQAYYHQTLAAVTGIVGDAYMNLGYPGLAIWGLGLALLLKLMDACSEKLERRLAIAAVGMVAVALPETYFIRVLGTTGFFWALILLYLLPRNLLAVVPVSTWVSDRIAIGWPLKRTAARR